MSRTSIQLDALRYPVLFAIIRYSVSCSTDGAVRRTAPVRFVLYVTPRKRIVIFWRLIGSPGSLGGGIRTYAVNCSLSFTDEGALSDNWGVVDIP